MSTTNDLGLLLPDSARFPSQAELADLSESDTPYRRATTDSPVQFTKDKVCQVAQGGLIKPKPDRDGRVTPYSRQDREEHTTYTFTTVKGLKDLKAALRTVIPKIKETPGVTIENDKIKLVKDIGLNFGNLRKGHVFITLSVETQKERAIGSTVHLIDVHNFQRTSLTAIQKAISPVLESNFVFYRRPYLDVVDFRESKCNIL